MSFEKLLFWIKLNALGNSFVQSPIHRYYAKNETTLYDEVNFSLIPGGSLLYAINSHDGLMLPYIEKRLERKGKQFITAQMSGSHWNYVERYPEEFNKFLPVQKKIYMLN